MRSKKLFVMVAVGIALVGLLASAQLASAETLTLYSTGDNFLFSPDPDGNYGDFVYQSKHLVYTAVYGTGGVNVANTVMSFDLDDSALTEPGYVVTINSLTLELNNAIIMGSSYVAGTVKFYELLNDFSEGNKSGAPATTGETCWNYHQYNTVSWNTAGAEGVGSDHGSTLLASYHGAASSTGYKTFTSTSDFADLVEDTIGDTLNLWGMVTPDNDGQTVFKWYSHETSGTSADPRLIIDYTKTEIPEPGTLTLLACGLVGLLAYAWRKRK